MGRRMPAPATNDELLDLVRKSGVLDEKRLDAYVARTASANAIPAQPGQFAGVMVRDGLLTHFQAEQFLQGKWRRFTIGRYKVLERLGAGGMGSVYLCEHKLMRRRVAVKVLPTAKADDPASLERFYREARAVAALDHPNIVRAYDIDQDDKLHFLVMEFVDGANFQEIVKRSGPLDVLRAAHYIRQAALGIQHAHEAAGLVHRDIKPGNILVDRNGIVKILDMGLARFFHDTDDILTKKYDENVLGTADYLAPEQALDSHGVDIRADIYSLGATFYFILTGRPPFAEGTVAQKLIWHQTRQPKSVRLLRPDVPEALAAILEKAMAKDPAGRYQTPTEVAEALAPWTTTPIPPPPEVEMPQLSLAAMGAATGDPTRSRPPQRSAVRHAQTVAGVQRLAVVGRPRAAGPGGRPGAGRRAVGPGRRPAQERADAGRGAAAVGAVGRPRAAAVRPSGCRGAARRQGSGAPGPLARAAAPGARPGPVGRHDDARPGRRPAVRGGSRLLGQAGFRHREPHRPDGHGPEVGEAPRPVVAGGDRPEFCPAAPGQPPPLGRGRRGHGRGGHPHRRRRLDRDRLFVRRRPAGRPDGREPIRVDPSGANKAFRTLKEAILHAHANDHIVLAADVQEDDLTVNKVENLTIESAPERRATWRTTGRAMDKLLSVSDAPGFHLKGITFDGDGKTHILVQLNGACPGLTLDALRFDGIKTYGLVVADCDGAADRPVVLSNLSFDTTADTQTAVYFFFGRELLEPKAVVVKDLTFGPQGVHVQSSRPDLLKQLESVNALSPISAEFQPK